MIDRRGQKGDSEGMGEGLQSPHQLVCDACQCSHRAPLRQRAAQEQEEEKEQTRVVFAHVLYFFVLKCIIQTANTPVLDGECDESWADCCTCLASTSVLECAAIRLISKYS